MSRLNSPEGGLAKAIATMGTSSALARALGVTPSAVLQWEEVPLKRLAAVSRLTGLRPEELRPDFFTTANQGA
jgi:DNA-binding transcriptional regulator YdaS (Cro superfamily)